MLSDPEYEWEQHASNNKTNFIAQAKQLIVAIGKRQSYVNSEPVDIDSAKTAFVNDEKLHWANAIKNKPKLDFLMGIKSEFGVEPFIKLNLPRHERSLLSQLRYGILQIRLETGRYKSEKRTDRLCKICNEGVLEDQYHFVLRCPIYNDRRNVFIEKVKEKTIQWENLSDNDKFINLFTEHPRIFGKYVKDIFLYRKSQIYK